MALNCTVKRYGLFHGTDLGMCLFDFSCSLCFLVRSLKDSLSSVDNFNPATLAFCGYSIQRNNDQIVLSGPTTDRHPFSLHTASTLKSESTRRDGKFCFVISQSVAGVCTLEEKVGVHSDLTLRSHGSGIWAVQCNMVERSDRVRPPGSEPAKLSGFGGDLPLASSVGR